MGRRPGRRGCEPGSDRNHPGSDRLGLSPDCPPLARDLHGRRVGAAAVHEPVGQGRRDGGGDGRRGRRCFRPHREPGDVEVSRRLDVVDRLDSVGCDDGGSQVVLGSRRGALHPCQTRAIRRSADSSLSSRPSPCHRPGDGEPMTNPSRPPRVVGATSGPVPIRPLPAGAGCRTRVLRRAGSGATRTRRANPRPFRSSATPWASPGS